MHRVAGTDLYALSSSGQAAVPGYWAGYLAGTPLGAVASLDDAWQDRDGTFLYCGRDPGHSAAALAALRHLAVGVRFLWIADPVALPALWGSWALAAVASGSGQGITWRVSRTASFDLGGYLLVIEDQAPLTLTSAPGWQVTVGGLSFFAPDGSRYPAQPGSAALPLDGGALGALTAAITTANAMPGAAGDAGRDDLQRLGVELRYAMPGREPGEISLIPMPILSQAGARLAWRLSFDPIFPLLPERTALTFAPASHPLGSSLRTVHGHPVTLTPAQLPELPPGRLAFCFSPPPAPAGPRDYYLAPDGAFTLTVPGDEDHRLLLGLSGSEYVELNPDATATATAVFTVGQPGYAPAARYLPSSPVDLTPVPVPADEWPLDGAVATTAYLSLLPEGGRDPLPYYAAPQRSPWFAAQPEDGFLRSDPIQTATLPLWQKDVPLLALPVGGFAGIGPDLIPVARLIEEAALAPARRAAIGRLPAASHANRLLATAEKPRVTAQGLMTAGRSGSARHERARAVLELARFRGPRSGELKFTSVGPELSGALAASDVFFVVADRQVLTADSSIAYRLDDLELDLLAEQGVPPPVITSLRPLLGLRFETEQEFRDSLPADSVPFTYQILAVAGLFIATAEDWTFQLSPWSWRTRADPTLMLVKNAGRSVAALAADRAAWGWQAAAGDLDETQALLLKTFAAAQDAPAGSPLSRFFDDVVANPAWNGVLFLNAPVAAVDLPADLQFVTAGVEEERLFARHVGFAMTSLIVSGGEVGLGQTALFGLIDYADPADQVPDGDRPFDFKTQRLTVRFAGGTLADLSAQLELMVNRLFGELATMRAPEHGNNLVLAGSCQRQHGVPSYVFALAGPALLDLGSSILASVEVTGAALQARAGSIAVKRIAVDFALSGSLRFAELPYFDLFSYGPQAAAPPGVQPADGYLRFSGLVIGMDFPVANPKFTTFTADESRIAIDRPASLVRPDSLAARFPVKVTGLIAVPKPEGEDNPGVRPADLGFAPVLAPVKQASLEPPWYGMTMSLDLGTLGALAGSAGITVNLLAGWAPGRDGQDRPVYLGLQLASALASGLSFPVQGVLKLGFKSFEFDASDEGGQREYLLRLRHLALSVLALSVPPGDLDVVLFCDPDAGAASALGWYAAYAAAAPQGAKDTGGQGSGGQGKQAIGAPDAVFSRLRAGRRSLVPGSGLRVRRDRW